MADWHDAIRQRLGQDPAAPAADTALVDELAQHLEDRFRERRAAGATVEQARAAALAELEDHHRGLAEELARARRRAHALAPAALDNSSDRRWFIGLWQDVRYAARTLRRSPGFAIAAILTVALTTGPTSAVLGIANWLFARPMPGVAQPHRLATVNFGTPSETGGYSVSFVSYGHVASLVSASPSVHAMAGWQPASVSVAADGVDPKIRPAQFVSGNFFDTLGVRPLAGRTFLAEEDARPGGANVVILSERLARVLFPASPALDRTVHINGYAFTVVGVVPAAFPGARIQRPADLWMTGLTYPKVTHRPPDRWAYTPDRGPFYQYIARLAPGGSFERADVELRSAALALSTSAPEARKFTTVRPMLHAVVGMEPTVVPLMWSMVRILVASGLLLIILGAANLANLFVFRSVRRGPEVALRRALGASGSRLVRLQLAETMLVAFSGGLLGLAFIAVAQQTLGHTVSTNLGPLEIPVDWRLAGIAFGLSLVVGLVLGIVPQRLADRVHLSSALTTGGRLTGRVGARLRSGLAVAQLALSLTLVVGALLFVGTLRHLRSMDSGFDAEGVTRVSFAFNVLGYPMDRSRQFLADVTARIQAENPTFRVAYADAMPMAGVSTGYRVFAPHLKREDATRASAVDVSTDYFAALGIPIVAGRAFTAQEGLAMGPPPAVMVSETLAKQLYGTTNVVGRMVTFAAVIDAPQQDVPIVGVTADVRFNNLTSDAPPLLFRPGGQMMTLNNVLIVRAPRGTLDVQQRIRAAAAALDPALPIGAEGPMGGLIDMKLSEERLFARTMTALALIGFVLAAVGLHGLVSQTGAERTREFGVRLAIGATRGQIIRLVLRSSLLIIALGTPIGLGMAYGGARLVASRLHGVTPGEPGVFAVGVVSLIGVALLASLLPARSASRANPVDVLRND